MCFLGYVWFSKVWRDLAVGRVQIQSVAEPYPTWWEKCLPHTRGAPCQIFLHPARWPHPIQEQTVSRRSQWDLDRATWQVRTCARHQGYLRTTPELPHFCERGETPCTRYIARTLAVLRTLHRLLNYKCFRFFNYYWYVFYFETFTRFWNRTTKSDRKYSLKLTSPFERSVTLWSLSSPWGHIYFNTPYWRLHGLDCMLDSCKANGTTFLRFPAIKAAMEICFQRFFFNKYHVPLKIPALLPVWYKWHSPQLWGVSDRVSTKNKTHKTLKNTHFKKPGIKWDFF